MKKVSLVFILLCSISSYGQKAIIHSKDGSVDTVMMNAFSDTMIMTRGRNFNIQDVSKLEFENQGILTSKQLARLGNIEIGYDVTIPDETIPQLLTEEDLYKSEDDKYIDEMPFDKNGQIRVERVIEVKGATAKQLYLRSKLYFAETFNSANDVIQLDDNVNYIVLGKGKLTHNYMTYIDYSVKIQCREGRYKFEIYGLDDGINPMFLKSEYYKKNGKPKYSNELAKKQILGTFTSLEIAALAIMNKPVEDDEDDW